MRAVAGSPSPQIIHVVPGRVACVAGYFAPDEAEAHLRGLVDELAWKQDHVRMGAREIPMPRLVAWYGDAGAVYRYSGTVNVPLPWTPRLDAIRARLEADPALAALAGEALRWNSVLANHYRGGQDSMGLHADDERELGPAPVIASVSFGAARGFVLRPRRGDGPSARVELDSGSLLLMYGDCQRALRHGVPKTKRAVGPRVNLTFRRIFPTTTPG